MQISHDFGVDIEVYAEKGIMNPFPLLDCCPNCGCHGPGNIHRHGYYSRYGIQDEQTWLLMICRYRCQICEITISILPDFLIPYFQYTLWMILKHVKQLLEKKKERALSHQLCRYHLNRFLHYQNWVHTFFMEESKEPERYHIKKAINYVVMILDFGESPFFRRSWGHLQSYFMARSVYHK